MTLDDQPVDALQIEAVSHSFGKRKALDAVSLRVGQSGFCALLGQNGAGKTTLFSLITRLYDNSSGSIRVLGYDVRRQSGLALRNLGVVFQNRTLDADLSVMQNLIYHAALQGMSKSQAVERGMKELDRIGLADRQGEKVRALSGGQMRRVEIARALMHSPRLLLLDEPTVGLDIGSRQAILSHVRRLVVEDGLGVLWATHLIDEIDEGDTAYILHQGKVLAQGGVNDIVAETGTDSLKAAYAAIIGPAETGNKEVAA
jgi:ABC-2 type transport system ATP-binding protein